MKEKKLYSKKGVGIVLVCAITLCSCSTGETSKNDFNKHKLEISGQGTKIKMVSENFSNQTGDGIKDAVTYLSNTKGDTSDEKEVIEFNENTVALNEGDKSYIYQLVEEDDKTYVDMYNENGELLQQSIMENEGEEVVDVSYCDNIEEESDKQDVSEEPLEITVKDIDEVVETEEVGATEYGNEIAKESTQSRNVNSDRLEQNANLTNCNTSSLSNNMENGIINLSKNSIYYLKYENLFSNNNLDLNNGLGKGWFYLGGKSYSGCMGYLSRKTTVSNYKSAKKFSLKAGVSASSAFLLIYKAYNKGIKYANIASFLACTVVDGVVAYACSAKVDYRTWHWVYKVQVDKSKKVWYSFCSKQDWWECYIVKGGNVVKVNRTHRKSYHTYRDNLYSNIEYGIDCKLRGRAVNASCQ